MVQLKSRVKRRVISCKKQVIPSISFETWAKNYLQDEFIAKNCLDGFLTYYYDLDHPCFREQKDLIREEMKWHEFEGYPFVKSLSSVMTLLSYKGVKTGQKRIRYRSCLERFNRVYGFFNKNLLLTEDRLDAYTWAFGEAPRNGRRRLVTPKFALFLLLWKTAPAKDFILQKEFLNWLSLTNPSYIISLEGYKWKNLAPIKD